MMPPQEPSHGGLVCDELRALGIHEDDVLDFSVNVNPYGPCPEIRRAALDARIERYPDPRARPAAHRIAEWLDVEPERVLVASGAVDVFWALANACLAPGDTVLIAEPAFSEMRAAATFARARVVEHRSRSRDDFAFDGDAFGTLLRAETPRLAYLASPANPTGILVPADVIRRLAGENPSTQIVADISFLALGTEPDDEIVHTSPRVLWVRSFTKELSVPGLRVGIAVGPPALVARLHAARPPWSVSAAAQAVAAAAATPEVRTFVAASRERSRVDRERLTTALRTLRLPVHEGAAPYVLVDLGPARTGRALRAALLGRHRILIRDAASFGLPHHVRLAARPARDVDRLVTALEKELNR